MAASRRRPEPAAGWRAPPSSAERAALEARPRGGGGLCASCRHLRLVRSDRAVFVRCLLAESDPGYERYPVLPVFDCAGHRSWTDRD